MNIRNLTIGHKLTLSFGTMILLLAILSAISYTRVGNLGEEIRMTNEDRYPKIVLAQDIKSALNEIARSMRNMLLMSNQADIDKQIAELNRDIDANTANIGKLEKLITSDKGKLNLEKLQDSRKLFSKVRGQFQDLFSAGKKEEAQKYLYSDVMSAQLAYMKSVDDLIAYQEELMLASQHSAEELVNSSHSLVMIIALMGLAIGSVLGVITTRRIRGPLVEAVQVARKVAEGDLTSHIVVKSGDEVGQLMQALQNMNRSLVKIVGDVRHGAEGIASASGEIATGNMDLSGRTERQASSLEETASSMEELASTVKQNSDNARQAKQLATSASDVAARGGAVMSDVVTKMEAINESARKIVDIIGVIDGIAFQTNILSLNAAVEAARAGEQGRGFSVVANEVRNLAQRSAAAAKEIKVLIGDSVEKVEAGSKLVGAAGTTMEEIVASVTRVSDIIAEISAAGDEQSAGIEQINQAVIEMDDVTQQNASLVEEAAAAATAMQEQAGQLAQLVSVFKIDASGATAVSIAQAIPTNSHQASSTVLPMVQKQAIKPAHRQVTQRLEATTGNPVSADGDWEEF